MAVEITAEVLGSLAPSANGMPIFVDDREPEIEDPSQDLDPHHWQPACGTTSKLTRCLEAIRDVSTALAPLSAASQPESDKRLVKQLITPIYSFAIALRDLYNDVLSNRWTKMEAKQQRKVKLAFESFSRAVPTGKGSLKTARDKIAAHLDKESWTTEYRQFWNSFSVADVLGWIRNCIRMLDALVGPDIYSWTRNSGYRNVVILMNVDGNEVTLLLDEAEKPKRFLGFRFVVSPKWGIAREARELGLNCIALVKKLGLREGTTWRLQDQPPGTAPGKSQAEE